MSAPLVGLGRPWPTGPAHAQTGWRPPLDRVRLVSGLELHLHSWGDAVGGGYNGGFAARSIDDELVGRIEYNSAAGSVLIAMIEVEPAFRRSGASDALLMRLLAEFPDAEFSAGLLTASGARWWRRVRHAIPRREE